MSDEKPYSRFIEHMRGWVLGLPETKVLRPLLELRLTADEAGFLADLPFLPHTIEQLAEKFQMEAAELMKRLDPLAERGVVFRHESKNTIRYALNDSMFTLYRSPFWAGTSDEETQELAALSNEYFYKEYGYEFGAYQTMGLRALPVEKTIADTRQVLPYEDLRQVLEAEDYFCTSHCPCRQRKNLDPDAPSCRHETFNCLHFGRLARYMVKNRMGKEITREDALQILSAAADAGLVHGISNTKAGMDTICNCCSCCCLFVESVHVLQLHGHQPSNYVVQVDENTCKGCALCVKRCPMDALQLRVSARARNKVGKVAVLNPDLCIGCGVCAHKCPTESLSLVHREGEQDFPENFRDMAYRMGQERARHPFA
jgi:NAD-dependent dihydropyrimidine dehydrogenase PreA subunit